jgi:hypothetical protein
MSRLETRRPVLSATLREIVVRETERARTRKLMQVSEQLKVVGARGNLPTTTSTPSPKVSRMIPVVRRAPVGPLARANLASGRPASLSSTKRQSSSTRRPVQASLIIPEDVADELAELSIDEAVAVETRRRAELVAKQLLMEMGLEVKVRTSADGSIQITGTDAHGRSAEVLFVDQSGDMTVKFEDLNDAVHPLDPHAGDVCVGALQMSEQFNSSWTNAARPFGIGDGDSSVETVLPAQRGQQFGQSNRESRRSQRSSRKA